MSYANRFGAGFLYTRARFYALKIVQISTDKLTLQFTSISIKATAKWPDFIISMSRK